jgi:hypothetical protein
MNTDEPSNELTEVLPLGFWVGKVRSIVVWPPRLGVKSWKHIDAHTETAFSYGDHTAFASEMLSLSVYREHRGRRLVHP